MRIRSSVVLLAAIALTPISAAGSSPAARAGAKSARPVPAFSDVKASGNAQRYGGTHRVAGNQPIVGIARTRTSHGYWEASVDGGVFAFGDARFLGSMGGTHLNQPVVGIAATPTGKGYWLVANDGGIFSFGDARFLGSMGGTHLNQPVVGIAATPTGKGYWLVANDGGIFTFGDARYFGSMGGVQLSAPVVSIAATKNGRGYYLLGSDGGVFTFGNARFLGAAGQEATRPMVGIAVLPASDGYWLVNASGQVDAFGKAAWQTEPTNAEMTKPIVGIAATGDGKGYWIVGRGTTPVYFLRGEQLATGSRDVHGGTDAETITKVARDLVAGPNAAERAAGLTSAIPAGTQVNSVKVSPFRNVTIDLSAQFVSGGGSLSMQERVAQVVYTLTRMPGIDKVSFSIDGQHVTTIGGEGLLVDPPVTRRTFESFLPQVMVVTPGPGDIITSPLVITGEINSFEGGANFELNAADGRLLASGIGQGAMGFWLPFASALAFNPSSAATGTLAARPSSGLETRPPPDAVIPVRFRP